MIRSSLFTRLFSAIVASVIGFSAAIYLFSVPLIEEKAFEIELNASRTILDNVFILTSRIKADLEDQRNLTVEAYKTQLRNALSLAASYLEQELGRADRGEITEAEARARAFEALRSFKYGNNDYIWVTDYDSVIRSHPDPEFMAKDASGRLGRDGLPILPSIVKIARERGEGFYTYPWERLGETTTSEKISYFIDMPSRGLVVGTGAYLADIDREVERRKSQAVEELRQTLRSIQIARTGYVYIFDAGNNMIIHPNPNIEGIGFTGRLDPATGKPISEELKEVAENGKPLFYLWDKPTDQGNYAYEKISWVRHFSGFDWYIASSVYVEELRRSSKVLGDRLLAIALALLVVASAVGYVAVMRLVSPLKRLASTAERVQSGDLDASSGIRRDDEIGMLASAFDTMIMRVRGNIASLDARVLERTLSLEDSEQRQRLILDAIPAAIAYVGRDEVVRFANRGWAELVMKDASTIIGRDLAIVIGKRAYSHITPPMTRTWSGEEITFEYAFSNRSGRQIITKNTLIPQRGPDQSVVAMFVLTLDVTAEKLAEQNLLEAQRMKAVGQLSGGLAHDFNNLLSIILGNLANARDAFPAIEGLDGYLEPAIRAGRRGADITARLLAFSRNHPLRPEAVEVGALVRDAALLLRQSLPPGIRLRLPRTEAESWAVADSHQLVNALINLVLNAKDAIADNGTIAIETRQFPVHEPVFLDEPVRPGAYVEIVVRDNGPGLSPEVQQRAFEPFFTTKTLGSGLGLSMVYGFVKQSGGYINLDSPTDGGARVTILLPSTQPAAVGEVVASPIQVRADGGLALVAEDDEDVRQVIRAQLIELGYSVIEAGSGDEALELAERVEGLKLVLSDVMMPGLSGVELAGRLRKRLPHLQIILMSGYALEAGVAPDDLVILKKPWDKAELFRAIALG